MSPPAAPISPFVMTPQSENGSRIEAVQTILTRSVDVMAGYDKMLPEAEAHVAPILRKMRETHHEHVDRLAALILALGGTPDTSGSFMSTVNKAVVSLRAMFDEIDGDAVERAIGGEEWITEAFNDAIARMPEGNWKEELVAMRAQLDAVLVEARAFADQDQ